MLLLNSDWKLNMLLVDDNIDDNVDDNIVDNIVDENLDEYILHCKI